MRFHSLCKFAVKGAGIYNTLSINRLHKALDNVYLKLTVKRYNYTANSKNGKIGCYPFNTCLTNESDSLLGISHSRQTCGDSEYHSVKLTVCDIVKSSALSKISESHSTSVLLQNTAEVSNVGYSFIISFCFLFIICFRMFLFAVFIFIIRHIFPLI